MDGFKEYVEYGHGVLHCPILK